MNYLDSFLVEGGKVWGKYSMYPGRGPVSSMPSGPGGVWAGRGCTRGFLVRYVLRLYSLSAVM